MQNKNTILKIVYFLILYSLVGFSGCYTFGNILDEIISPTCIFEYDGNMEESYAEVKKEIFRNELTTFFHDDRKSAVLVTGLRTLLPNEIYSPNLFFNEQPFFVGSNYQEGSLVFLFTDLGNSKTKIELFTKTFVKLTAQIEKQTLRITPSQHPFLQKHVDIISNIPKMKLVYIPPEPYSKELHSWQPTRRDKTFVLPDQDEEQSEPRGNSIIIASLIILSSILVYFLLGGTI